MHKSDSECDHFFANTLFSEDDPSQLVPLLRFFSDDGTEQPVPGRQIKQVKHTGLTAELDAYRRRIQSLLEFLDCIAQHWWNKSFDFDGRLVVRPSRSADLVRKTQARLVYMLPRLSMRSILPLAKAVTTLECRDAVKLLPSGVFTSPQDNDITSLLSSENAAFFMLPVEDLNEAGKSSSRPLRLGGNKGDSPKELLRKACLLTRRLSDVEGVKQRLILATIRWIICDGRDLNLRSRRLAMLAKYAEVSFVEQFASIQALLTHYYRPRSLIKPVAMTTASATTSGSHAVHGGNHSAQSQQLLPYLVDMLRGASTPMPEVEEEATTMTMTTSSSTTTTTTTTVELNDDSNATAAVEFLSEPVTAIRLVRTDQRILEAFEQACPTTRHQLATAVGVLVDVADISDPLGLASGGLIWHQGDYEDLSTLVYRRLEKATQAESRTGAIASQNAVSLGRTGGERHGLLKNRSESWGISRRELKPIIENLGLDLCRLPVAVSQEQDVIELAQFRSGIPTILGLERQPSTALPASARHNTDNQTSVLGQSSLCPDEPSSRPIHPTGRSKSLFLQQIFASLRSARLSGLKQGQQSRNRHHRVGFGGQGQLEDDDKTGPSVALSVSDWTQSESDVTGLVRADDARVEAATLRRTEVEDSRKLSPKRLEMSGHWQSKRYASLDVEQQLSPRPVERIRMEGDESRLPSSTRLHDELSPNDLVEQLADDTSCIFSAGTGYENEEVETEEVSLRSLEIGDIAIAGRSDKKSLHGVFGERSTVELASKQSKNFPSRASSELIPPIRQVATSEKHLFSEAYSHASRQTEPDHPLDRQIGHFDDILRRPNDAKLELAPVVQTFWLAKRPSTKSGKATTTSVHPLLSVSSTASGTVPGRLTQVQSQQHNIYRGSRRQQTFPDWLRLSNPGLCSLPYKSDEMMGDKDDYDDDDDDDDYYEEKEGSNDDDEENMSCRTFESLEETPSGGTEGPEMSKGQHLSPIELFYLDELLIKQALEFTNRFKASLCRPPITKMPPIKMAPTFRGPSGNAGRNCGLDSLRQKAGRRNHLF
ncbi:unnamed protein product [Protopolystoma xenopodis]|uniref:DUF5738 domain-containing protein n=1 Tax=Protopolystoma xenopodis TaxID=117903 RepID=A0A448WBT8_9PLAT|nr:unnamed protein product [Protopolystoma xenopodis]